MRIMRKIGLAVLTVAAFLAAASSMGCQEFVADSARSSAVSFVTDVVSTGLSTALGGD